MRPFASARSWPVWVSPAVTRRSRDYVFDLADWDNSAWVIPDGDQMAPWAEGTLLPMLYTRAAIEASIA